MAGQVLSPINASLAWRIAVPFKQGLLHASERNLHPLNERIDLVGKPANFSGGLDLSVEGQFEAAQITDCVSW